MPKFSNRELLEVVLSPLLETSNAKQTVSRRHAVIFFPSMILSSAKKNSRLY